MPLKLFLIFLISPGLLLSQPDNSKTIKLATWNLMWLDSDLNSGKIKRSEEDFEALHRYALELNADVIAVQEVENADAIKRVFGLEEYNYEVSARVSPQRTGFVIRKNIQYIRNPDLKNIGLGNRGLRWGTDITVNIGKQKIRMLCVHLKSGCFGGNLKRSKKCRILAKQLPILENWIDSRYKEGVPFVVMGDFNRRIHSQDPFWMEINDNDPAGLIIYSSVDGKKPGCLEGKYDAFIDNIILGPKTSILLFESSFKELIYSPAEQSRYKLSDHCPISIVLKIEPNP